MWISPIWFSRWRSTGARRCCWASPAPTLRPFWLPLACARSASGLAGRLDAAATACGEWLRAVQRGGNVPEPPVSQVLALDPAVADAFTEQPSLQTGRRAVNDAPIQPVARARHRSATAQAGAEGWQRGQRAAGKPFRRRGPAVAASPVGQPAAACRAAGRQPPYPRSAAFDRQGWTPGLQQRRTNRRGRLLGQWLLVRVRLAVGGSRGNLDSARVDAPGRAPKSDHRDAKLSRRCRAGRRRGRCGALQHLDDKWQFSPAGGGAPAGVHAGGAGAFGRARGVRRGLRHRGVEYHRPDQCHAISVGRDAEWRGGGPCWVWGWR